MKRLTNILSYLWLLLLMVVSACNDMEETIDPMLMEGEVELTIQTEVLGMEAGTRAVPTDEVNTIVALAFDESNALIKKVDAVLTNKQTTSGTLKIKVPKRTRTIHFLGNYTKEEEAIASIETIDDLQDLTTDDMTIIRYWGKATFDGTNASLPVTLYRNIAKVTLTLGEGLTGYIAGFLNYHTQGSIVPGNSTVGTLNAVGNKASHGNGNLGTEYYLFEHANSGENLYAICNIGGSYYKVAFATNNNGGLNHFPIVRNHKYNINIKEVETALGSAYYDEAKDRNPINNAVVTEVDLSVNANLTELYYNKNKSVTVTAKVPEGVSALNITADNFDVTTTSDKVTEKSGLKYTVNSAGDIEFTFTLKEGGNYSNNQEVRILFAATAKYGYEVTNPEAISIMLKQAGIVNIEVEPSAYTLNYANSSVEDLLVNVTIPKGVTGLTFSSSDFTIKVASGELVAVENKEGVYTITHAADATGTTIPVRIRLKEGVSKETASFTFSGTTNDESVIVEEASTTINLTPDEDTDVRWQGSVPLSENDSTMVPLLYDWFCRSGEAIIDVRSRLKFEFTNNSESYFEITEIRGNGISDGWNDPKFNFSGLENGNRYNAITSGNGPVIVTMDQGVFDIIKENYQTKFLGDTDVAMAIRGKGITLTKVSILPAVELPTVAITASPYTTSLNYSTNAVSDLTVNVTIPKEVTTLTFKSDYFDVGVVVDTLLTAPNNGTYTVVHPKNENATTSTPIRLRLKKNVTGTASFTFSGVGDDVNVTSAVVDNITLTQIVDDNIRWHGDAALEWGVNAVQIPLLYSWFYDESNQLKVPVGSTLRVEYITTSQSDAIIQFAEVNGEWNDDAYYFSELRVETNNNGNTEVMGLNLAQNTGIYENNRTTFDLKLTQDVLTNMTENRTNLLGETDVVMAIQGANVRLKSISVIPNNNPVTGDILLTLPNGEAQNAVSTSLYYATGGNSIEEFTLDVTVPDGVTQITIDANDFGVSWSTGNSSVSYEKTYTFSESAESRTKRFKFTLNNKTTKTSTITVRDNNNNATTAIATVNISPRAADADGGTTIWSGTAQLEWSINYLSISNVIPNGYKVRLNFTSVGGAFKFHDGYGSAFKLGKENYTHQQNNDTYLNVPAGTTYYEFEVNDITEGTDISNGLQGFKLNGDNVTMTSIVIYPPEEVEGVETVIYTGPFTFANWNDLSVQGTFTVGTKVTFKFSTGGIFKIHNGDWKMLYIPSFADRYPQDSYNRYIEVVAGEELSFVVDNKIQFQSMNYDTNKQTEDVPFTGETFSGLILQGDGGTVLESITTTTYGTTP